MTEFPSNLVDLVPAIRRKQAAACEHPYCEVDDNAASLTCAECGAEIDPWWFIRRLAVHAEEEHGSWLKARAEFECWHRSALTTVERLHAEIGQLTREKNRLWNEPIHGRPLGSIARRARRKSK